MQQQRARGRAFTLIELMVVVAIIGLLSTIVVVSVVAQGEKAKVTKARADLASIRTALDLFRLDTGRHPERLEDLWQQPPQLNRWGPEPYLRQRLGSDPWGHPYRYDTAGGRPVVRCTGADGLPGGEGYAADLSTDDPPE